MAADVIVLVTPNLIESALIALLTLVTILQWREKRRARRLVERLEAAAVAERRVKP